MYRWSTVRVVLCLLGHHVSAQAQHNDVSKQAFSVQTNQLGDLKQCAECLALAEGARTALAKSDTQQLIMKVLGKACMLLPTEETSQCLTYVDNIGPMFMAYVIEKLDPTAVCQDLGICDPSGHVPVRKYSSNLNGTAATAECRLCEMLVKTVKDELDNYQWYIKGFMDDFCARLPQLLQTECQSIVDQKFPDVLKILDQILDPQVACLALKACQ